MDAMQIKSRLMAHLQAHSGFEPGRKYLGMSRISECPLRLYRECLNGRHTEQSESMARRCYRGYLFERDALSRLEAARMIKPGIHRDLLADFDERFRGHTDGETVDGDLLEVKSVRAETFDAICASRCALPAHADQVQLYMRYGGYQHGIVLYICTETFRHYTVNVFPGAEHVERLIAKAKGILTAIDAGRPPECTCGRCFGAVSS